MILPSTAMAQSNWERVQDDTDMTVFVDRSSITGSGGTRSISTRTIYLSLSPEGNVMERVRTEEFDCSGSRARSRRTMTLYGDGRMPRFETWGTDEVSWYAINPGTLGARKLSIACGRG
jgi:hypothetical protein